MNLAFGFLSAGVQPATGDGPMEASSAVGGSGSGALAGTARPQRAGRRCLKFALGKFLPLCKNKPLPKIVHGIILNSRLNLKVSQNQPLDALGGGDGNLRPKGSRMTCRK
jgi:hypothetical protein